MEVVHTLTHMRGVAVILGMCLLLSSAATGLNIGQANEKDLQAADGHLTRLTTSTGHQSDENASKKCEQFPSENCPVGEEADITAAIDIKASRSKRSVAMTNGDVDGSVGYRSVRGGGGLDRNFLRFGRKGGGLDKNFLRFGRGGLDKNFLRFGRNIWQLGGKLGGGSGISDNGQVDANRINQLLENLRQTEEEEDEEPVHKNGVYNGANSDDLQVDNVQTDQLKTKRGSLNNNFLRYGRRNNIDVFGGKRGSLDRNFLRFGKRSLQDTNEHGQDDPRPNPDVENLLIPCQSGQECDYLSTEPPAVTFSKLIKKRSLLDGHWMTTTNEEGVKSIRRGRSVDNSVLGGGLQENFIRFGKR